MSKRGAWITAFLSVTSIALAGELYAAFDTSANTTPWTDLIVTYIPAPITYGLIGLLVVWLPIHFFSNYRARKAIMHSDVPTPLPVPASTAADARQRAFRTLVQGLAVDVGAAVVLAVGPALAGTDFAWSRAYWLALAGLAAKTAIQTAVSYAARHLTPPA